MDRRSSDFSGAALVLALAEESAGFRSVSVSRIIRGITPAASIFET
jgi:hypothetical protein